MRTTLTIDPDIAVELKRRAAEQGVAWKDLVNSVLREGLAATERPAEPRRPVHTRTFDCGPIASALQGVHSVHDMLACGEGEDHR